MKALLPALSGIATLIALPLLYADQVTDFSVFQPVQGISANIYIDNARIMVQSSGTKTTMLKKIKPEYLHKYSTLLYKIGDVDHNGTVDISTLDNVDKAATRFCYQVFSYHKASRKFNTKSYHTLCQSAAGNVVYAHN